MAISKYQATLQSSTTNSAGGTTNGTTQAPAGDVVGLSVAARITNGGTGPTDPCELTVYYRTSSGGTQFELGPFAAGTDANETYGFNVPIPDGAYDVDVQFTGNTGQDVTVEAELIGIDAE